MACGAKRLPVRANALAGAALLAACVGGGPAPPGPDAAAAPTGPVAESFELDTFRWRGDISGRNVVTAVNEWGDLRTRTLDRGELLVSAMIQKIGTTGDEFEIRIEPGTDAVNVAVIPLVAAPRGRVDLTLMIPPGKRLEGTTRDGLAELRYKGDVTARTRGGRIAIRTPAHARARSETGDITVKLSGEAWQAPLLFASESGDISVVMPATADLHVRARTKGAIDMAVASESMASVRDGGYLETTLGAGGPELVIDSGSGDVYVASLAGR